MINTSPAPSSSPYNGGHLRKRSKGEGWGEGSMQRMPRESHRQKGITVMGGKRCLVEQRFDGFNAAVSSGARDRLSVLSF